MTPKLAHGFAMPKVAISSAGGERGKEDAGAAVRFEDALAGGKTKRKLNHAGPAASMQPVWRMDGYGTKLKLETATGLDPDLFAGTEEEMPAEEFAVADTGTPFDADEPVTSPHAPVLKPSEPDAAAGAVNQFADDTIPVAPFTAGEADIRPESVRSEPAASDTGATGAQPARSDAAASAGSHEPVAAQRQVSEALKPVPMEAGVPVSNAVTEGRQPRMSEASRRPLAEPDQRSEGEASRRIVSDAPQRHLSETAQRGMQDIRLRQVPDAQQSRAHGMDQGARPAPGGSSADTLLATVSVLGSSGAVAPAQQPPLSATAAGVVAVIGDETSWRQAAAETALPSERRGFSATAPVNTLRIQLNPAELGMVTARLTVSGTQLSVELQVESNDARQRLANDGDAILKALRAIGYDVEKVTIQQTPSQGAQAQGQPNGGGREQFQADQQGRQDAGSRGQNGEARRGNEGGGHGHGEAAAERAGSGVYI